MELSLSTDILDQVVERARDNAIAHEDEALAKTIDRASKLLRTRQFRFDDRNQTLVVGGSKGELYQADARPGGECQCFSYSSKRRACIHRVAAKILVRYFEIATLSHRAERRKEQRDRDNSLLVKSSPEDIRVDGQSI